MRIHVTCTCPTCHGQAATVNADAMDDYEPGDTGWARLAHAYVGLVAPDHVQAPVDVALIVRHEIRAES